MENGTHYDARKCTAAQADLLELLDRGLKEGVIREAALQPRLEKVGLCDETIGKVYAKLKDMGIRVIPAGEEAECPPDLWQQLQGLMEQYGGSLSERQRHILRLRFGERKTLAETAEQFGVTRERIRQIESMTISLLFRRQQWARKKIRNFYE